MCQEKLSLPIFLLSALRKRLFLVKVGDIILHPLYPHWKVCLYKKRTLAYNYILIHNCGNDCFWWDSLEQFNIFIRIPEDKIEHWDGLTRLIVTQLFRYLGGLITTVRKMQITSKPCCCSMNLPDSARSICLLKLLLHVVA